MASKSGGGDSGIKQAYTELLKADRTGDYERALKAANRILKAKPTENLAFHCKVVCLVKLQKFEETLLLMRKTAPSLTKGTEMEKAYCEYRLNRNEDALATLDAVTSATPSAGDELRAQLLYRLERYADCRDIYRRLVRDADDGYDVERRANLLAVHSQLGEHIPTTDTDSYEEHYNFACCLIRSRKYKEALKHLKKSEDMCRSFLQEDGATEEEIGDELAPIHAQTAYCQQMLGEQDAAHAIYADIVKNRRSDGVVVAVASNNSCCGRKDFHQFDVRKRLKTCLGAELKHKLTAVQKAVVCFNNALLQLLTNQLEPCRKNIGELRERWAMREDAVLLEAALLGRQKDVDRGIRLLDEYGDASDAVSLALAQLALVDGKYKVANNALEKLKDKRRAGPLSLRVALNLESGDEKGALKMLSEACDQLKQQQPTSSQLAVLLEECATLNVRIGDEKQASTYLEELRKLKQDDAQVLAQLIQIYSRFDQPKAQQLTATLALMDDAVTDGGEATAPSIDVDALESSAEWILFGERYRQKKEAKHAGNANAETDEGKAKDASRKKRKRKTKLPKNVDANVPLDAERWLPKQERTYYKKRKDKRHKDRDIGRGTQGAAAAGATDQLDASKMGATADVGSPKPSPAPTPVAGPRQQRPGGQQAKKKPKKKGAGKW